MSEKRPRTIFKPRTRKPNFAVSVAVCAFRLSILLAAMGIVAGIGYVLGIVKAYTQSAPTLDLAEIDEQAQTSFFYDSNGRLLTDYKGSEDRVMVSIEEIPQDLQHAFVSVEDARFYTHNGVDVKRIAGAFLSNVLSGGSQGGSTITQQLIKNSVLTNEVSYKRKIQEAYLAMELETVYSKDQILESYLNTIYLGENYYGVKTAARGYFGKELGELTLRECAMLAGITRSPYYYNPRRNIYVRYTPQIVNNRTDYALRRMYECGYITWEAYQQALDPATARVLESAPGGGLYNFPYYIEYAVQDVIDTFLQLNNLEDTTANRNAMEQELRTGGYHIYLCIDTDIQTIVEQTLINWKDYPSLRDPNDSVYRSRNADGTYTELIEPQAAACVIDYRTGQLVAVVGGRTPPTARKTLNRATDMNMPVGSTIKPLSVYAPALELGAYPGSVFYNMNVPIYGWSDGDGRIYSPSNYGGGGYTGPVTLRKGIEKSYNTVAAQTLMYNVGVDRSVAFLHAMGIDDKNIQATPYGLALGSSGITPVQLAAGYSTIANGGVYCEPISFTRIEDSDGVVLIDRVARQIRRQVFSESTAWMMVDMLEQAVQKGTGTKAQISGQTVAGKTGTNSDYRGVTFAGMTGWYAGSVWVGHDNYKALSSNATGGSAAAPLWQAFMSEIHRVKRLENRDIVEKTAEEVGLVRVTTCAVSGYLATDACYNDANGYGVITDWCRADQVPTQSCPMHQTLSLCTETGMLANSNCPSVRTLGAVIIPMGHPLYDFIDTSGDEIAKYLGNFALLKLTQDSAYNTQLIQNYYCSVHTDEYAALLRAWEQDDLYTEAQDLVSYTYELLIGRGSELTDEQYMSVVYYLQQLEGALESMSDLDSAVSNLRFALQFFN